MTHSLTGSGTAMTELVFLVEETPEGEYLTRALGTSIVTEADDLPTLREAIRDAVRSHFDGPDVPLTRPALRSPARCLARMTRFSIPTTDGYS